MTVSPNPVVINVYTKYHLCTFMKLVICFDGFIIYGSFSITNFFILLFGLSVPEISERFSLDQYYYFVEDAGEISRANLYRNSVLLYGEQLIAFNQI